MTSYFPIMVVPMVACRYTIAATALQRRAQANAPAAWSWLHPVVHDGGRHNYRRVHRARGGGGGVCMRCDAALLLDGVRLGVCYLSFMWPLSFVMLQVHTCLNTIIIPAKAFARDYIITGVGLSVCLFVCLLPR